MTRLELVFSLLFAALCLAVVLDSQNMALALKMHLIKSEIRDSPLLEEIAGGIAEKCEGYEPEDLCRITEAFEWVEKNIKYRRDSWVEEFFFLNNDINHTYYNGNDCEGRAVFLADLLKHLNVSGVYIALQQGGDVLHACVLVDRGGFLLALNCHGGDFVYVEKVV